MSQGLIKCDLLILGAGAVGISIGIAYLEDFPGSTVVIADKEDQIGKHASGRNSGVLHAGFYYSPESLKAKFCREGNIALRALVKKHGIPLREVGKVVVTRNEEEDARLESLFQRGLHNKVELELLDESELSKYEPLAVTKNRFMWSPTTAVSDPGLVIAALRKEFEKLGGKIHLTERINLKVRGNEVQDSNNKYDSKFIVNAAGAQADRISREIGVGLDYAMLPFMGVYRYTRQEQLSLKRLVYPVPHPLNPFLGVHFTLTVDGLVKIGPTAIPIVGREQYSIREGWSIVDSVQAIKSAAALVRGESHNLGSILKSEWPKIMLSKLVQESAELVPTAISVKNWKKKPPGIRAQLVHLPSGKLEQDFVVRSYLNTVHVLNAVSPGWTSAIPFGKWLVEQYLSKSMTAND
jgi:L-2-hydroxyglutarate oxidase LhgO